MKEGIQTYDHFVHTLVLRPVRSYIGWRGLEKVGEGNETFLINV